MSSRMKDDQGYTLEVGEWEIGKKLSILRLQVVDEVLRLGQGSYWDRVK